MLSYRWRFRCRVRGNKLARHTCTYAAASSNVGVFRLWIVLPPLSLSARPIAGHFKGATVVWPPGEILPSCGPGGYPTVGLYIYYSPLWTED